MTGYCYDGTFNGLLTLIYEVYKTGNETIRINAEREQSTFGLNDIYIMTDFFKAGYVEKVICEKLSKNFFNDMKICFLSCDRNKDAAIVHTAYKALNSGEEIINSMDRYSFLMSKLVRQVLRERHKYLGVLRFGEMKDGILFSAIEPKNNVLPVLLSHFKKRMKKERFAIFDKKRGMIAYYDTKSFELFSVKCPEIEWSDEEKEYSVLWKAFHENISVKERENKKLQQSNLPKYLWEHLVEDMRKK